MQNAKQSRELQFFDTIIATKKSLVTIQVNYRLRDDKNKNGKQLIYVHITGNAERTRISSQLKVFPKDWDFKRQYPKNYMSDEILILEDIKSKLFSIMKKYRLNGELLTMDKLMYEYKTNLSSADFIQFCKKIWKDQQSALEGSTARRYMAVIAKLEKWKSEIPFGTINYSLVKQFEKHLVALGNCDETVSSNMRIFKKYLSEADRYGIKIPVQLDNIKISNVRSRRQGIKPDELKKLYQYYQSDHISKRYKLSLGYFLFSCFTSLRVSDILNLDRKDIKENFILKTKKTGSFVQINMTEKSQMILEKCPELFVRKIQPQKINDNLKGVAEAIDIQSKLTMHVGRHTFGENYIRLNGNLIDLKNIMGHSSVRQTEEYAKIAKLESSKNMKLIDDIF